MNGSPFIERFAPTTCVPNPVAAYWRRDPAGRWQRIVPEHVGSHLADGVWRQGRGGWTNRLEDLMGLWVRQGPEETPRWMSLAEAQALPPGWMGWVPGLSEWCVLRVPALPVQNDGETSSAPVGRPDVDAPPPEIGGTSHIMDIDTEVERLIADLRGENATQRDAALMRLSSAAWAQDETERSRLAAAHADLVRRFALHPGGIAALVHNFGASEISRVLDTPIWIELLDEYPDSVELPILTGATSHPDATWSLRLLNRNNGILQAGRYAGRRRLLALKRIDEIALAAERMLKAGSASYTLSTLLTEFYNLVVGSPAAGATVRERRLVRTAALNCPEQVWQAWRAYSDSNGFLKRYGDQLSDAEAQRAVFQWAATNASFVRDTLDVRGWEIDHHQRDTEKNADSFRSARSSVGVCAFGALCMWPECPTESRVKLLQTMIRGVEASFRKPVSDARKYVPVFVDLILKALPSGVIQAVSGDLRRLALTIDSYLKNRPKRHFGQYKHWWDRELVLTLGFLHKGGQS